MQKNPQQIFRDANPWDGDALNRRPTAEYLTGLIDKISDSFVISLKSQFGTGKSNFLKRWRLHLKNEGYKSVIYFDAWALDYAPDPLAAVISVISKELTKKQKETLISKVNDIALYGLKSGADRLASPVLAMVGVDPVLAEGAIAVAKGAAKKVASVKSGEHSNQKKYKGYADVIRKFEDTSNAIREFKSTLSDCIEHLYANSPEQKRKVIIMIDELDRCRPNYAIELLECLKHIFDVKGLVFILAIDDNQLVSAVSSVYGDKINGEGYLRKFFDWQLYLPPPNSKDYCEFLLKQFSLENSFPTNEVGEEVDYLNGRTGFIQSFSIFSEIFELSLRDQEQTFININLILKSLKEGDLILSVYLGLFACVHITSDSNYFRKFCNDVFHSEENIFNRPNSILQQPKNIPLLSVYNQIGGMSFFISVMYEDTYKLKDRVNGMEVRFREGRMGAEERPKASIQTKFINAICEMLKNYNNPTIAQIMFGKFEQANIYTQAV